VDTGGRLLTVKVHAADISDTEGGMEAIERLMARYPSLRKLWVDQGYKSSLAAWAKATYDLEIEVVKPDPGQKGFVVQPRRWVVERTHAWLGRNRQLAKHYDYWTDAVEAWAYLASAHLLLKRLAPDPTRRKPYAPPKYFDQTSPPSLVA
jgi:putative transposase